MLGDDSEQYIPSVLYINRLSILLIGSQKPILVNKAMVNPAASTSYDVFDGAQPNVLVLEIAAQCRQGLNPAKVTHTTSPRVLDVVILFLLPHKLDYHREADGDNRNIVGHLLEEPTEVVV